MINTVKTYTDAYGRSRDLSEEDCQRITRYYERKYLKYVSRCWYANENRWRVLNCVEDENVSIENQLSLIYYSPSLIFKLVNPDRKIIKTALKSFLHFAAYYLDKNALNFFDETAFISWKVNNDDFDYIFRLDRSGSFDRVTKLKEYILTCAIKFLDKYHDVSYCSKELSILKNTILENKEDDVRLFLLMNIVS